MGKLPPPHVCKKALEQLHRYVQIWFMAFSVVLFLLVAAVPQHCVGGAPEDGGSCQVTGNEGGESEKQEKNCQGG